MPRLSMFGVIAAIVIALLTMFGRRAHHGEAVTAAQADVNHDGAVTMRDLIMVMVQQIDVDGNHVYSVSDIVAEQTMIGIVITPPAATPTPRPPATSTPVPTGPCGRTSIAPATYSHVIWIWMENHTFSNVIGNGAAPYTSQLAAQCGAATNYQIVGSPSLPNYIGATSGGTFGIADDAPPSSHPLTADNLFRQVRASGRTAHSYQESMPSNCFLGDSGSYAVKHNPEAYYTGGSDRAACNSNNVPMGTPSGGAFLNDLNNNQLPTFAFVTPNLCNDTHDCSVATGDNWLKSWVPKILASAAYQSGTTAVIIMYDEYTPMPNVFITPSTASGTRAGQRFDHYSLLRTTEEMLGIGTKLGAAASAPSMRAAFGM